MGAYLTSIAQPVPAFTAPFKQLSVSTKSGSTKMDVTTSAIPPVFVMVMVWAVLAVPTCWDAKLSEIGCTVTVVGCVPAVAKGICQIPRP